MATKIISVLNYLTDKKKELNIENFAKAVNKEFINEGEAFYETEFRDFDVRITYDDRDIEFIQFKRWLERLYDVEGVLELNHKSCEMIADDLYDAISAKYSGRFVEIDVAEDGENGCSIFYPRP